MTTRIQIFFFLTYVFLLVGCAYEFSEDSFIEINPNDPNININLIGFENGEETKSSKTIQYSVSGIGSGNFEIVIKVNEEEIFRSQERAGEFYLFIDELEDGQHNLNIEYVFPTNSGSLADSLDAEFYAGKTTYSFKVDKSLAEPFGIASVNIIQGSIYIELNPITDNNFEEAYLIIKNEDGYIIEERPISQKELDDLEIHDGKTIIYNPSYAIKVKNPFNEAISEYVLLPTKKMNFTIQPLSYRSFKLIYNEHPLYGNIDVMNFKYTYRSAGLQYHNINPKGGETTINYGYYFGDRFTIYIDVYKNRTQVGNIYEKLQVGNSLPVSEFEEITYIPSINKYFILDIEPSNNMIIYQLNGDSFKIENSQRLTTLGFSGDFKSLETDYTSNTLIINMNSKAIVFNPITFSAVKTYRAIDFNTNKPNADVYYRGDYIVLEEPWASGEVNIYQIANGSEKFNISKTTNFFSAIDASFFYANGDLYKLDAGNFTFVKSIQDSRNRRKAPKLDHMTFDNVSNSAIYGWYRNTYYLDLSNYNEIYIFDTEIVYDVKYSDNGKPFINCDHFSAGNKSHIYNNNLNETRLIDTFSKQPYRYFNNIIFSPRGFYLKSNLFIY